MCQSHAATEQVSYVSLASPAQHPSRALPRFILRSRGVFAPRFVPAPLPTVPKKLMSTTALLYLSLTFLLALSVHPQTCRQVPLTFYLTQTTSHTTPQSTFTMGNKYGKSSPYNAAKSLVEDAISTHPVVIFSKTYCPYCHSAKSDIRNAGASVANFTPPKVFELDRMGADGRAIQAYLAELTGRRTVPNVFIGGRSVGGGDDIAGYARRNVLKQMLTQAPDRLAANNPGRTGGAQPEKEEEEKAPAPNELVEEAVSKYPVVIFSKSWCPYCHSAKANIARVASQVDGFEEAKIFELDQMDGLGEAIQSYLMEKTGRRTVPNVFIGGVTVGGGDDVGALAARGELLTLISDAVKGQGANAEPPTASEESSTSAADPAEKLIDDAIAEHPVVVFSKTWCPYCKAVKGTLATVGAEVAGYSQPKVFELDTMGTLGEDVQRCLAERTGQRTVPNVFIGGKHVGGNDVVSGHAATGQLRDMLTSAVGSTSAAAATKPAPATKEIVFGAGCFWGVELAFQRVMGVVKTEVGYTNGRIPRVTYDAVCSGLTGSAEVVRVTYDPAVVSLAELLKLWESRHDPTSLNKQGNDVGTQYRSGVYYNDDEQAAEIEAWKKDADSRLKKAVVSEIAPVSNYCTAEEYHQQYLEKKGQSAAKGDTTRIRCYG
eukprot:GFKZ01001373.1.p1 GENE.GFKZ01001373.1~~GFKZ01001373.1.p1  ORF type:complete len:659 (+),score=88.98 GFKZ01001373.1:86-2062(+)